MASDHPFQHLFETLGRVPAAHAESVNRQAIEVLTDILTVPVEKSGRCILLRAPRAGHGKTHLLSRIQHQMGATHEFIPLHAAFGCRIDADTVIDDTLRRLLRQLPASGGLCVLDLVTRRLFASALQPLVGSGEVPCQDREGALAALRARPVETFDFHHPNAVTAHWARENFEVLGQRLALELSQRCGLPVREIGFWVDALFRFASAPLENSNRLRVLAEQIHASSDGQIERLEALLGLLTQLMRVVLVADDLEGFSADETAALRLAAFLGSLRQSVDRVDVVLSINLDIWESAFLPRLSGGLADRLSEVVVELEPLKESEMAALLDSRVPGLGSKVLEKIDLAASGNHARGLIRAAGMAWLKATAMDSAPPPVIAPAMAAPVEAPIPPVNVPVPAAFTPAATPPPVFEPQPVVEPTPVSQPLVPEPPPLAPPVAEPPVFVPAAAQPEPPVFIPAAATASAAPAAVQSALQSALAAFEKEPEPAAPAAVEPPAPIFQAGEPAPEPPVAQVYPEEPVSWPAPQFVPAAQAPEPPQVAPEVQFPPDSPFSTVESLEPPKPVELPPAFTAAPPAPTKVDSPFFDAAAAAAFMATPTAVVEPTPAPEPYYPPVQSPFQIAPPEMKPEPAIAANQPMPESPFQAMDPSPAFMAAPPVEIPPPAPAAAAAPAPVEEPVSQAAQIPPPPTAADTDRVDDLLRQFRERYGRGSL